MCVSRVCLGLWRGRELRLNKNPGLIGSIPSTIGLLTNLVSLEIREAGLTGSIPNSVTDLTRIVRFLLNDNQLTGTWCRMVVAGWMEACTPCCVWGGGRGCARVHGTRRF